MQYSVTVVCEEWAQSSQAVVIPVWRAQLKKWEIKENK